MWKNIEERVIACGDYIVKTGCTVRTCAIALGTSKSTVHKDVTERLSEVDPALWEKAKKVLDFNLKERHLRGGDATKRKYEQKRGADSAKTIFS
ncbi:MAG: sporulation transcriptional regulator SpoIIID [Clostridia bacterium]|nr:sporulation transcriptional regulator SpoIIID [Clostridia bacterium]